MSVGVSYISILRQFAFPLQKTPFWQDQKDEQMLRIRSQIGYQHDPNLEKIQKKLRQTPCLVGLAKPMMSLGITSVEDGLPSVMEQECY